MIWLYVKTPTGTSIFRARNMVEAGRIRAEVNRIYGRINP